MYEIPPNKPFYAPLIAFDNSAKSVVGAGHLFDKSK
jgi:hypothetical protein